MVEVQLFFDEDDRYENVVMYEHIMRYLMHHNIHGATMFAALGGFGAKRHLHFPRKIGNADEGPVMLMFVDTEENVDKVLPHLRQVLKEGLIIKKTVEVLR